MLLEAQCDGATTVPLTEGYEDERQRFGSVNAPAVRMHTLRFLILLCTAGPLFYQDLPSVGDPAQVLFNLGTKDETAGRLERAKLTFVTLASTYATSPLTAKVRVELGAIYMFMEGQTQVRTGKTQAAYDTFRTLMRVYPESPLAKLADQTAKTLGIPRNPRH